VAVLADERLRLKARVATSLHLLRARAAGSVPRGGSSEEWERLVSADAWAALRGASLRGGFPVRVPRASAWILVPAVACAALALWLPTLDLIGLGARREARAEMQKAVEEEKKKADEALAEVEKEAREKDAAEARRLLELLRKRAEDEKVEAAETKAGPGGEPKRDALVEMGRREDLIKKAMEGKAFEPLKEALKELRNADLKKADLARKLAEALKEGAFKEAKEALEEMKRELSKLSQKPQSELTQEEKERMRKLAEELSRLSRLGAGRKDSLGKLSSALAKSASGLDSANLPDALKNLDMSAEALEELARLAEDGELIEKALEIVQLTKEQLAALRECPMCGTPYCPDCGKPRCACKPGTKPGGT
jgi:hypothetical protein